MKNINLLFTLCYAMTLCIACTSSQEPKPASQIVADSVWRVTARDIMNILESYLPYDGTTVQYYTNEYGRMDSTCFSTPHRDSTTFVKDFPDSIWMCGVTTRTMFHGEDGWGIIEFTYNHDGNKEYSESLYDSFGLMYSTVTETVECTSDWGGFEGSVSEKDRASLWIDTLRYVSYNQLDSGAYAIIVRHKGLVEYSFDGQEIWRLVEE